MQAFRIGVFPARALEQRALLLGTLEQLFPIAFEAREAGDGHSDLDGVLALDGADPSELPPHLRSLLTPSATAPTRALSAAPVEFTSGEPVARVLRGRVLGEERLPAVHGPPPGEDDETLAKVAGRPVWWRARGSSSYASAFAIEELAPGDTLREHLRAGRFMGLVPLLHLLGEISGGGWSERPLQASFVIDDPNLHRTSYGFLRYPELIRSAATHGYHVGLAMVPLDSWLVSARAAQLFRDNGESLSLLVHGNDHVARELGRLRSDEQAERAMRQALRRVAAFERRSGVRVRRVMAPPHGACSEQALRAMFGLGFEAACVSRPHPWRDGLPALSPLLGWHPAELVGGGLPILPRHHLDAPREELVFSALLGQPLILYGHHWDFAAGLDVLERAAAEIDGLGEVRWGPLDEIAERNYESRVDDSTLVVEMYSRRVIVEIPRGVDNVRVQTRELAGRPLWREAACGRGRAPMLERAGGWASGAMPVRPPARVELSLSPAHPLQVGVAAGATAGWWSSAPRPWPLTRRVLVESRDRIRPLLSGRATG